MSTPGRKPPSRARSAKPADQALLDQACAELGMPRSQVLAWKRYSERIVILFKSGQKLSREAQP